MKTSFKLLISALILALSIVSFYRSTKNKHEAIKKVLITTETSTKQAKKTLKQKAEFSLKRLEHELSMQRNPFTGEIPLDEKNEELQNSIKTKKLKSSRKALSTNFGGRTRAVRIDLSDNTSNTILSGGVSSGLFRTTNGGNSWVKVSPNDDIHNVTAIAQDPRMGFQNIWYYATGELLGNSATLGSPFRGRGIWKSNDNGINWSQITQTNSVFESFDSLLDYTMALEVSPINGDLMIASYRTIYRYDGISLDEELRDLSGAMTDVVINSQGRVFAAFQGNSSTLNGVWTSPTGNGSWTRIAQNGSPLDWNATGRIVLANAPSNDNVVYALYENGDDNEDGDIEADLWKYDLSSSTWTNYSGKLPDEPGGDLAGNDPFSIQGGYDLVVSVKPDNENFVLIGGTGAYKIEDIANDNMFLRIGGYKSLSYASYIGNPGTDKHHADVHELYFNPHNYSEIYSGTDGGIHKSQNVLAPTVSWTSLNNNYLTFQFYHIAIDPLTGSNIVFGGAQDNGTNYGGTNYGLPNNTEMIEYIGGDGVAVGIARRDSNSLQLYYGTQNGKIRTNKPNFRTITPNNSESQFVTYFYLDPDNTNNLYYAGESVLYRTSDAENVTSETWDNLGALENDENISRISATRGNYSSSSSYLLIGGKNGSILRIDDPQNTTGITEDIALISTNITPSGFPTNNSSVVTGLAIHPTNKNIVLATYSNYGINNIFLTTNATDTSPTWTVVERNLDSHSIRSAAITEINGTILYFVGTARGLYSSNDPTQIDWSLEGGSEIGLPVISDLAYRPSDNKLLIGTHGNGMYETTVVNLLSDKEPVVNKINATIYPNPAVNQLNINSDEIDLNKATFIISELSGRSILRGTIENKKIDVRTLKTGSYLLSIESENEKQVLQFIKN